MRTPFAPLPLLLFIVLLALLVSFVQVGALTLAFDKLGLSAESGFLLLFVSLFGSVINLPLLGAAVGIVALVSHLVSRPLPGIGIGMPIFVAPIAAALTALLLGPEHSAALAYVSGTLGVLIGADLLRLKDIRRMGTPVASIGGAGTFDGIFMTGIVAVLLT